MSLQSHFAVYKDGKPFDDYRYPTFQYAALAWEDCEPDCDVVELDSVGRILTTFRPAECRLAAQRFRNPNLKYPS